MGRPSPLTLRINQSGFKMQHKCPRSPFLLFQKPKQPTDFALGVLSDMS